MSDALIGQKIYEMIAGASPITDPVYASATMGMVHRYERWAQTWEKFIQFFKDPVSGRIFGWEIGRISAPGQYLNMREEQVSHTYVLHGYMGVQDAAETDTLFNAKIEELRGIFRADKALGGLNGQPQAFNADVIDVRMFGGVMCHFCEIKIPVMEVLS